MKLVPPKAVRRRCPVAVVVASAALASCAAIALAGSAHAATPIEVGSGGGVSLAVDASGTAHVAWLQGGSPDLTRYCRVPEGTSAGGCPGGASFPPVNPANGLFGRSLVAVSGGTVVVLWRECCPPEQVNARISGDSGLSFPTARTLAVVGADNPTSTSGDPITNGGFVGWSDGVSYQQAPLAGPAAQARADLFGLVAFASASALYAGRPFVVGESDASLLSFRRSPAGNPDADATWTAPKPIPTTGTGFKRPALAADADLFLAYTDAVGGEADRPLVRRYVPAADAFGDPVAIADQSANEIDVAVDGTGVVHVVWSNSAGSWWSTSDDRGDSFTSPVRLTRDLGGISAVQVGAGADGSGFAGLRTIDGRVWVVPLEDTEDPRLVLRARRSVRVGRAIRIRAICDEDCRLRATGKIRVGGKRLKLRTATADADADEKRKLKLKLSKKVRKRVTQSLAGGRRAKAKAKIKVVARDAAGNKAKERITVKLRSKRRRR